MAIYDKNISPDPTLNEPLPKTNENYIHFSDGAFYPYLKYLINQVTKIPNTHIFIKDYGENNPFLQQSKEPKVYCEMHDFRTPCISGAFYGNGDMHLFAQVMYRVYFVNDNYRAPFLFESALKGNIDSLDKVTKAFIRAYNDLKFRFCTPKTITISSKKAHKEFSTYPILIYDVLMNGYIIQNIEELENMPFDQVNGQINLK